MDSEISHVAVAKKIDREKKAREKATEINQEMQIKKEHHGNPRLIGIWNVFESRLVKSMK
jgi:hypothetical protein